MIRSGAIALVAALGLGLIIGNSTADTETEYRIITKTKTVKAEPVRTEVEVTPAACIDLARNDSAIVEAARQYDQTTADLLEIMSDLRVGINMQDSNIVNELETRLRDVSGTTVGAASQLGSLQDTVTKNAEQCGADK